MDPACLQNALSDEERRKFEEDGYLVIEDALPPSVVTQRESLVDELGEARAEEVEADGRLHLRDFLKFHPAFLDLLDWPTTFPKVWGVLGWHIQLYIAHIDITPPLPAEERTEARLGWHQDSGRLNIELETEPQPRISMKVGYFLTDTSEPGRGNFWVVPGSHKRNSLDLPEDETARPEGAIPVCVKPGAAVFFDRRLWHSRSPNHSDISRARRSFTDTVSGGCDPGTICGSKTIRKCWTRSADNCLAPAATVTVTRPRNPRTCR